MPNLLNFSGYTSFIMKITMHFGNIWYVPVVHDYKIRLYGSNHCLSSLMLWVRILIRARCTTLCDKVCQWIATGRWFSPEPPVSSTNKTDRHDIAEILFCFFFTLIMSLSVLLCNVCVCYIYILKMSKKIKVKKKQNNAKKNPTTWWFL
jgi:hypothetical protein